MAIVGDSRFQPGINTGFTGGKVPGKNTQEVSDGDKFAPGGHTVADTKPNFHGGEHVRKGGKKQWKDRVRDAGNFAGIHSAGNVGGVAAAIATSQLHYPDGRWNLGALADKALAARNFPTEFPPAVLKEVEAIKGPAGPEQGTGEVKDLRSLKWSAIDNKTSRDIDQLEWSERLPNGDIRVLVAVTDVDALVPKGSALDEFTKKSTTSIYTPDKIYNMLPERLSTDLISLNKGEDRLATVIEYTVTADGSTKEEKAYQAMVHSHAQLDYPTIGDWFEGKTDVPPSVAEVGPELVEQLEIQREAAERLQGYRERNGALNFESNEVKVHVENGVATDVEKQPIQESNKLVENFMVTSNQVMSRFIRDHGLPTIQRVVKRPEKWDRIVEVAAEKGYRLPKDVNDPEAGIKLGEMMREQQEKDPKNFGELSTSIVRLIGRGEFVAIAPGEEPPGHFGMGITDYVQSTAGMRRRGDVVNARVFKIALKMDGLEAKIEAAEKAGDKQAAAKAQAELQGLKDKIPQLYEEMVWEAENLTAREQDSKKAERQAEKSAIASMLEDNIGDSYDAVVTGAKGQNTWVKISDPPVEGNLSGGNGLKVGKKIRVTLESVNVEEGFIDFKRN